jgi:NADP-dependent 3-hydroxy acid dehydrogenase YdfG
MVMAESYRNKVCVVTGAGAGIGRCLVRILSEEGAVVYGLDVSGARLDALAEELGTGASFRPITADVSSRQDMEAAAKQIQDETPQVDLLINNAGVTLLAETADVTFAQWKRILDINFLGVLHGVHYFYPAMVVRGAGQIANIASIAGAGGYASAQAYATSKGAVIGLTRSLEVEARTHGVHVCNVCPSYVATEIFSDSLGEGWTEESIRKTFMTPPVSSEIAARAIISGIRKRKKNVVFPLTGRLLYWITSWCPLLLVPLQKSLLKRYRAAKT